MFLPIDSKVFRRSPDTDDFGRGSLVPVATYTSAVTKTFTSSAAVATSTGASGLSLLGKADFVKVLLQKVLSIPAFISLGLGEVKAQVIIGLLYQKLDKAGLPITLSLVAEIETLVVNLLAEGTDITTSLDSIVSSLLKTVSAEVLVLTDFITVLLEKVLTIDAVVSLNLGEVKLKAILTTLAQNLEAAGITLTLDIIVEIDILLAAALELGLDIDVAIEFVLAELQLEVGKVLVVADFATTLLERILAVPAFIALNLGDKANAEAKQIVTLLAQKIQAAGFVLTVELIAEIETLLATVLVDVTEVTAVVEALFVKLQAEISVTVVVVETFVKILLQKVLALEAVIALGLEDAQVQTLVTGLVTKIEAAGITLTVELVVEILALLTNVLSAGKDLTVSIEFVLAQLTLASDSASYSSVLASHTPSVSGIAIPTGFASATTTPANSVLPTATGVAAPSMTGAPGSAFTSTFITNLGTITHVATGASAWSTAWTSTSMWTETLSTITAMPTGSSTLSKARDTTTDSDSDSDSDSDDEDSDSEQAINLFATKISSGILSASVLETLLGDKVSEVVSVLSATIAASISAQGELAKIDAAVLASAIIAHIDVTTGGDALVELTAAVEAGAISLNVSADVAAALAVDVDVAIRVAGLLDVNVSADVTTLKKSLITALLEIRGLNLLLAKLNLDVNVVLSAIVDKIFLGLAANVDLKVAGIEINADLVAKIAVAIKAVVAKGEYFKNTYTVAELEVLLGQIVVKALVALDLDVHVGSLDIDIKAAIAALIAV
jgi:hypothetical protein